MFDTQTMITSVEVAYQKGYEDARRDEIQVCIESLQTEAQRLSKALPELAEGIQVAAEILINRFEARSSRINLNKK